MTIKLYCFGESGNAYKAALTLELAGLPWEPVKVDFFNGESRTPAYRTDLNEMGEVPVMVDGAYRLTQSGAIMDYVAEKSGKLMADTPEERREVLRWILWDNHKLSSQAGACRYMSNFLPEAKRPPEIIAYLRGRLKPAYAVLDAHLGGRDWMVGRDVTIADLSCCGYLFYNEPFGFDRSEWPHIDQWLTRIQALPGWKHPYDLMPGSPTDRA